MLRRREFSTAVTPITMATSAYSFSYPTVSMMNSSRVSMTSVAIRDQRKQSSWYESAVGGLDYMTMLRSTCENVNAVL